MLKEHGDALIKCLQFIADLRKIIVFRCLRFMVTLLTFRPVTTRQWWSLYRDNTEV